MANQNRLVLRGICKEYKSGIARLTVLNHVSLVSSRAEILAIMGPSGSGKTTLLNLIAGLDAPSDGEVWVLGHNLGRMSDRSLADFRGTYMGIVFQDPHLLPGFTALENVVIPRLPWSNRSDLVKAGRAWLAAVGLADRCDHPPSRLSAGERQRVGIARALLGAPTVLVADEPTGNLDAQATDGLLELLIRLQKEHDLTVVIATHDPAVAGIADRTFQLEHSRLVPNASGTLARRPNDESC